MNKTTEDYGQQIDKILIDGNLNENLVKVITQICINLQKQFDISPALVNNFINSQDFISSSNELNQKSGAQIQDMFKTIEEQYADYDLRLGGDAELGKSGWESESCAYVVKEYPNGYRKYCNQHKYMHNYTPNQKHPTNHNGEFLGITDHQFVFKTVEQVKDEKILTAKMQYYQEYLNKLLEFLRDLMTNKIKREYATVRVKVGQVLGLNEWLKEKKDCFKTRFIQNRVTTKPESPDKNTYEYGGYIDIYLPNEKLEEYIREIQDLEVPYEIV